MSIPGRPMPVKPLLSILVSLPHLGAAAMREVSRVLGPPDALSPWLPFTHTNYYEPEMGPELWRRLVGFLHLADPEALPHWKTFTNEVERRFSWAGRRLVNLDPGYLTRERLVLATGKNFSHRLSLGHGLYGEITLLYQRRAWQSLPWTYPDYAGVPVQAFLSRLRTKYLWQLRSLTQVPAPAPAAPPAP